jgi:hypothetical protein
LIIWSSELKTPSFYDGYLLSPARRFLKPAYSVEEVGEYARKELDHVKTTCCSSIK